MAHRMHQNTILPYKVVDTAHSLILHPPSPLHPIAWKRLLHNFPGGLGQTLHDILVFGVQLGYEGPEQLILSPNLTSANDDPQSITSKLEHALQLERVRMASPKQPFISSPLGLVAKHDGGFRRIHHLSFPRNHSVNDHISNDYCKLAYTTFDNIIRLILSGGRNCMIVKRDIKDAFRMVLVAPHQQWLLGFQWNGVYYMETCLPFGLRSAPFLFNLFGEGLEWLLQNAL